MTNLDSVLKSRDITLPTKVLTVTAVVFPVVMHECESWTMKKVECWRILAFNLWCQRKDSWEFLDSKEIKPVNPKGNQLRIFIRRTVAEALLLWPPDAKKQLIGKDPSAGKDWGHEKGWQRTRWSDSITDSTDMSLNWLWEIVEYIGAWHAAVLKVTKSQTGLNEWTTIRKAYLCLF